MKTSVMILSLIFGLAAQAAGSTLGNASAMSGVELKACDSVGRKCLVIRASKTEGSQLKPIHQLKKPVVTISDSRTKTVERLEGSTGYLDLDNHQVVIYERQGTHLTEVAFDLNSLQRRESRIR